MIKSIKTVMRQEKEKYKVPCKAQDIIPVQRIWWLPTRNSPNPKPRRLDWRT